MNSRETTHPSSSDAQDQDISLLSFAASPAKARLAAAESASWKHVNDRLVTLFSPKPVPRFERNNVTLKALLELVKANEEADEERRLLYEARVETLRGLPERGMEDGGLRSQQIRKLEQSLPKEGTEALFDLSVSAALLSCSSGGMSEMEKRITDLTRDTFDGENDLLSLRQTQRRFERDVNKIQQKISSFRAETERIDADAMQMQTSTWNRETKAVSMKLAEYQDRIRTLEKYDVGGVRIENIVKRESMFEERRQELQKLEGKIVAMHGLPPELDVSRKEVERARNELEEWRRRRDRAFEGLVE